MYANTLRRSMAVHYAADCTISIAYATLRALARPLPGKRRFKLLVTAVATNILRCGLSYLVAPLVSACLSLLWPGSSVATGAGNIAAALAAQPVATFAFQLMLNITGEL